MIDVTDPRPSICVNRTTTKVTTDFTEPSDYKPDSDDDGDGYGVYGGSQGSRVDGPCDNDDDRRLV